MGELTFEVKDVPADARKNKNSDTYDQIVKAFNALPMNKCIEVPSTLIASSSLEQRIREMVTLNTGEHLKISKLLDEHGKVKGLRLSKVTPPKKRSQGETKTPQGNS